MAEEAESERVKGNTPPYIAFQTTKTIVKDFKEHGVPGRIDRSVLTNFSGAVVSQVLPALKFLHLTTSDNAPTDWLIELKDSYGDEVKWPVVLEKIVRHAYKPLFTLNLETATPSQFNERFKQAYPGADDVQRKSMTFFLNAAKEAKIPVSGYLMKNKKPRSSPAKKRAPKPQQERVSPRHVGGGGGGGGAPGNPPAAQMSTVDVLMKLIYDPSKMKPDEEQAVFTLIRYLRTQGVQ